MKPIFRTSIIIIVLVVLLSPLLCGYLFEQKFYRQIEYFQLAMADKGMQIKIDTYNRGWFQSTASISITQDLQLKKKHFQNFYFAPAIVYHIDTVIQHGPLVFTNGSLLLTYAYLESHFHLPDAAKIFLPDGENGFMQMNTQLALNGNTWKSHYIIPSMSVFGMIVWDGLTGDMVVDTVNHSPVMLKNKNTLGKFTMSSFGYDTSFPAILINPIDSTSNMTKDSNGAWNGETTMQSQGLSANWQKGGVFSITNIDFKSKYDHPNDLYHYQSDLVINDMKIPQPYHVSDISNAKYSLNISDIKASSIRSISTLMDPDSNRDDITKLFTPSSALAINISMNTNLGTASADARFSFQTTPNTVNDIAPNLNGDFTARISRQLLEAVLNDYIPTYEGMNNGYGRYNPNYQSTRFGLTNNVSAPDAAKLTEKIKTMVDNLVQLGYLVQDNNGYLSISINRSNQRIKINNKQIDNISDIFSNLTLQTEQLTGNKCFWLSNSPNEKNKWIAMGNNNIDACFALDSCGRGLSMSGGGCYKWAASADAKPEPWNADNTSDMHTQMTTSATAIQDTAYITNQGNNTISVCTINPDGSLSNCTAFSSATFNLPSAIIINDEGTSATILNGGNNTPSTCKIGNKSALSACSTMPGNNADAIKNIPRTTIYGKTVTDKNQYRVDSVNNAVLICPLANSGVTTACTSSDGNGTILKPSNITLKLVPKP